MRTDTRGLLGSIKETFLQFLETVPDAMVLSDRNGRIVLVNTNTEKLFGYGRSELLGKKVEVLMPARFRTRHRRHRVAYYANPGIRPMGVEEICRAAARTAASSRWDQSQPPRDRGKLFRMEHYP